MSFLYQYRGHHYDFHKGLLMMKSSNLVDKKFPILSAEISLFEGCR